MKLERRAVAEMGRTEGECLDTLWGVMGIIWRGLRKEVVGLNLHFGKKSPWLLLAKGWEQGEEWKAGWIGTVGGVGWGVVDIRIRLEGRVGLIG